MRVSIPKYSITGRVGWMDRSYLISRWPVEVEVVRLCVSAGYIMYCKVYIAVLLFSLTWRANAALVRGPAKEEQGTESSERQPC